MTLPTFGDRVGEARQCLGSVQTALPCELVLGALFFYSRLNCVNLRQNEYSSCLASQQVFRQSEPLACRRHGVLIPHL